MYQGLIGMVVLLLAAWAMSYHRSKVNWRIVVWGMSLQLIFGLIILRDDISSQVALVAFALLLVSYVLKDVRFQQHSRAADYLSNGLIALVVGTCLYFVSNVLPLGVILVVLLAVLVVNGILIRYAPLSRYGTAFLLVGTTAWMLATNTTGKNVFTEFSGMVESFLKLSDYGAAFMFGNLANEEHFFSSNEYFPGFGWQFAFKVLPTIIFFGGFMSVMYYLGIMQRIIEGMSHFVRWSMGTSGAESLSCCANIFVGQTEAPLLIKPFLNTMTKSELLTIMVGGFATIAGGVLAGYIQMGVPAGHLVAASIMSAPAALVMGKILYPETEHSVTAGDVALPEIDSGSNLLEAASNGITDGFKLALNVGAMLIGFIALIALVDVILNWMDYWVDFRLLNGKQIEYAITGTSPVTAEYEGYFPGSLQTLFGTTLKPLAWMMGVPWEDSAAVGNLLGVKLSLNEFVAYGSLGMYIQDGAIGEQAGLIAAFALCGFANFSSIGIQLGGISAVAPERKSDLAKVVLKAMFGGAFASWTTACIAGMLVTVV